MSEHAKFSPSGSDKRHLCPASYAVEQLCEDSSSSFAEEGTDCHELGAECLTNGTHAADFIGRTMTNGNVVNEEMADAVDRYVTTVREYARGHQLFVEQRVNYSSAVGISEDEGWGTSDAVVITADAEELIVIDAKFGHLQVDASTISEEVQEFLEEETEEKESAYIEIAAEDGTIIRKGNRQLMLYALGAYLDFGMMGDFKRIRLVIHQPRLDHLSEWDCTVDDLMAFAKDEAYAILQCRNAETLHSSGSLGADSSYFNPGPKQCRFCRFAGQCVPLANHVKGIVYAPAQNTNPDCPNDGTPCAPSGDGSCVACVEPAQTPIPPVSLSRHKLGSAMDNASLISAWLKAVRAEGERRAFSGSPPIGKDGEYKLVRGRRGKRKFADEAAAEAQLKAFRLKQEQMYSFKLISPTVAEKVLKEKPRQWKKLQPLISQSEGAISLAPATDKRPALTSDAASVDDFDDLTQQTAAA